MQALRLIGSHSPPLTISLLVKNILAVLFDSGLDYRPSHIDHIGRQS